MSKEFLRQLSTKERFFSDVPDIRQAYLDALVAETGQYDSPGLSGSVLAEVVVYADQEHDDNGRFEARTGYRAFQADEKDIVARFTPSGVARAMIGETTTVSELVDLANFLIDSPLRDYFERESAKDILAYRANRMQFINSNIQVSSDHHASIKMSEIYEKISSRFVGLISGAKPEVDAATDIAMLVDDVTDDRKLTLARSLETSMRRALMKEHESPGSMSLSGIFELVEELDKRGLLREAKENGSIVSQVDILINYPALAEILQANLVATTTETTGRGEQTYVFLARTIMHKLLEKHAKDKTRHTENASKALAYIFPNTKRPDSLSRMNLLNLANHINGGV